MAREVSEAELEQCRTANKAAVAANAAKRARLFRAKQKDREFLPQVNLAIEKARGSGIDADEVGRLVGFIELLKDTIRELSITAKSRFS